MQLRRLAIILFVTFATFNGFANEASLSDAEDNFNQGQFFYEKGEFEAAVREFSEAIKKSPGNSRYHHDKELIIQVDVYQEILANVLVPVLIIHQIHRH